MWLAFLLLFLIWIVPIAILVLVLRFLLGTKIGRIFLVVSIVLFTIFILSIRRAFLDNFEYESFSVSSQSGSYTSQPAYLPADTVSTTTIFLD